ncbi:hypothetical protein ACSQ67_000899 [Phaseolus vulgaris]
MVLNAEKRVRLTDVLSTRDDVTTKEGTSAHPAPTASPTTPLAPSVRTTPTPASPQACKLAATGVISILQYLLVDWNSRD